MERAVEALNRAANSNGLMNALLVGCFGALGIRSMMQQRGIEALEAEKDSLVKSNKAIKSTIWDWKKQLFAEAETAAAGSKNSNAAGGPFVPLSKLKAIYGDVTTPALPLPFPAADADSASGRSPASKIVI